MPSVDPHVAQAIAATLIPPFFYLVFLPWVAYAALASLAGR
jgi:hypothetical protein